MRETREAFWRVECTTTEARTAYIAQQMTLCYDKLAGKCNYSIPHVRALNTR